jgi:antitoxin component of RelBE/YafQ-DinJ toxin-antitoxin module
MTKVSLNITVDRDVLSRFKELCGSMDIKVSTKINSLMKEWIIKNGENKE